MRDGYSYGGGANVRKNFPGGRLWLRVRSHIGKTHPPPKEIPRRGPPGRLHLQYRMRKSGACAGEGLGGGGPRGPDLSEKALPGGAGTAAGWMQMSERIFPAAGYGFTSIRKSENIPPPKRNSPARAPGQTAFAIQDAKIGGLCRERSRRGRLGGGASPGEANPSKAFSFGGNLLRQGHPRSSPMVRIFTSGGARDRERKFCKVLRGILQIPVDKSAVLRYNNTQACGARRSGRGSVSQALRGRRGEDFHRSRLAGRRGEDSAGRVSPLESGKGGGNIHPGLCPAIVRSFVRPAAAPAQKSGKEPT